MGKVSEYAAERLPVVRDVHATQHGMFPRQKGGEVCLKKDIVMAKKRKGFSMSRYHVVSLSSCLECGAGIGSVCLEKSGVARERVHASRVLSAMASVRAAVTMPAIVAAKPDSFYSSWAWKDLRYKAIKLHGRKCQCCGWVPADGNGRLVVDHIKPRRKHPKLELELSNLQVLCNDCNMGKSNKHNDDFRV